MTGREFVDRFIKDLGNRVNLISLLADYETVSADAYKKDFCIIFTIDDIDDRATIKFMIDRKQENMMDVEDRLHHINNDGVHFGISYIYKTVLECLSDTAMINPLAWLFTHSKKTYDVYFVDIYDDTVFIKLR